MNDKIQLSIVIINYKTADMTIDCLKTVIPQLTHMRRVVVVDNCSNDGSAEKIDAWIKDNANEHVSMLLSETNSGFSGGNNLGIRSQDAELYLLLNSDTLLRENALDILCEEAKNENDVGLISPRLEWPDGTAQISCFKFHSPISEFIDIASTNVFNKLLKFWQVPINVTSQKTYPQWASFACIMIKSQVIEDIGFMDEGYFLYYEDVDYCRMARDKGWKVINNPMAHVVHLRGGSSDVKKNIKQKKRVAKYVYESRSRYFKKFYGPMGLLLANIFWHTGRVISWLRELAGKKDIAASEKQYIDIWTDFFSSR